MTFATAWKISGACLAALVAEAVLAYYLFVNLSDDLADRGHYGNPDAYTAGPMGALATTFYLVFGLTAAAGLLAPLVAAASWIARGRPSQPTRHTDPLPPERPH